MYVTHRALANIIKEIDIDKSFDISSEEFFTFMIKTLKIETEEGVEMTVADVEANLSEKYGNFNLPKNI